MKVWLHPAYLLSFLLLSMPIGTGAESEAHGSRYDGILFRHYDRDGDGKIEEWRRAEWRFYDRNGDGVPDIYCKGDASSYEAAWDKDLDGEFDWTVQVVTGVQFTVSSRKPTSYRSPPEIARDRLVRRYQIPLASPGWKFYVKVLGIASTDDGSGG